jgi:HlyD family secretion protein
MMLAKFKNRFGWATFPTPLIVPLIGLAVLGVNYYNQQQQATAAQQQAELTAVVAPKTVTALGRLEPQGKVIKLSAPASAEGIKIDRLLVKEGDSVKAGQLIAILDSQGRLAAAVNEAKGKVAVAQANLAKVRAGAKQGEIDAQKAGIGRLQAERGTQIASQQATLARVTTDRETQVEAQKATIARSIVETQTQAESQQGVIAEAQAQLVNAQAEYKRYETLYRQGAVAVSLRDSKQLAVQTSQQKLVQAQANLKRITASGNQQIAEARVNLRRLQASGTQQINEARANLNKTETSLQQQIKEGQFTLNKIVEVRPVDIAAAEADIQSAIATLKRAEANLGQAYIRSPQDGRVFEIYARPGEVVGTNGIIDIGQTSKMDAVIEVYQNDVSKIRLGQKVKITSSSLPDELQGTLTRIDLQVKRQNIINADPTTNIDERTIEVHVSLDPDSSAKAAEFTNLQVQAVIGLANSSN